MVAPCCDVFLNVLSVVSSIITPLWRGFLVGEDMVGEDMVGEDMVVAVEMNGRP